MMPTPHHLKNLAVPGNRYRLAEAAREGLLVSVRCANCRRNPVVFLAADLMQVLGPEHDALTPPFPCSKCGSNRFIEVTLRAQDEAAIGRLSVRRLVGMRQVPVWRNELLGDRPAPPAGL